MTKAAEGCQDLGHPELPRKRRTPNYRTLTVLDGVVSTSESFFATTAEEHYRVNHYYPALDSIVNGLEGRFKEEVFVRFSELEQFLLSVASAHPGVFPDIPLVLNQYPEINIMEEQLFAFNTAMKNSGEVCKCFKDIHEVVRKMEDRTLYPDIVMLVKLILLSPATSAEDERTFSMMQWLKTWLRSTMSIKRFNNLSLLNCHKDLLDKLDVKKIGNQFLSLHPAREMHFGKY